MVQSSRSRRPEAAEASRSPGKADFMRFWTARRRRGAAARQLRRTKASWQRPFCASRSEDRSCFFFESAWICLFDCQGRFSKEKPGTSFTVIPLAAKNALTTISSTTRHVGSSLEAMAAYAARAPSSARSKRIPTPRDPYATGNRGRKANCDGGDCTVNTVDGDALKAFEYLSTTWGEYSWSSSRTRRKRGIVFLVFLMAS